MNEPAIRREEEIISLFPGMETQVCHGWILRKMGKELLIYPLYYKACEENIPDSLRRCEELGGQSGGGCVFRIVEHTNYYLSSILTETGYVLRKYGVVSEVCLADPEMCRDREKKRQGGGLFLKKEEGKEAAGYVMAGKGRVIGIRRRELLFLPDGNLPEDVALEDLLQFAVTNGITRILADIPEREGLPEQYKRAGFNRQ